MAITLWKCDGNRGQVPPTMEWVREHCSAQLGKVHNIKPLLAKKYVRQAPAAGGTEYHGRGWFVQDTAFFIFNNDNVRAKRRVSRTRFVDA